MKNIIRLILLLALAVAAQSAENDVLFTQKNASNVNTLRTVTAANAITSLSTFRSGFGLAIGVDVQAYDSDLASWASVARASGFDTFTATPSFANLNALLTGDDVAGIAANNSFTGVNTFAGSFIRTPATITISEGSPDTGTIDITKGYSQAAIDEATTLTPSAAGTNGQFVTLDVTNSTSAPVLVTVDTGTDFSYLAPPGTSTVLLASNGTTLRLVGGNPAKIEVIATFVVDGGGSAISTTTVAGTKTIDAAYVLYAYAINATAATGTNTVKIWAKAYSTAIPTIANVINTSGVSLSSGTAVYSTTITDFTDTTFAAQDQFRCAVTAVDGAATDLTVTLYGIRL